MRSTWGPHDVKALIRAVGSSPQLPALMASTTAPNAAAWEGVIAAMGTCGRGRRPNQLRAKWKSLKAAFHHERAHRLTTGQPSIDPPRHYRRLLRLWLRAGRPAFGDRRYTAAMTGGHHRAVERPRRRQPLLEEEEEEEQQQQQQQEEEQAVASEEEEVEEPEQPQEEAEVMLLSSPDVVAVHEVEELCESPPPVRQSTVETVHRAVQTSPTVPVHAISVATNTEPQEDAAALREEVLLQHQDRVAGLTRMLEARNRQVMVLQRVVERQEHHVRILQQDTANLHVALDEHLATIRWLQGLLDDAVPHL